jgi:hypothetical protein
VRLRNASKMRYVMLRDQAGVVWGQARTRAPTYWEEYKPRTLLQWTVSARSVTQQADWTMQHVLWGSSVAMYMLSALNWLFHRPAHRAAASMLSDGPAGSCCSWCCCCLQQRCLAWPALKLIAA